MHIIQQKILTLAGQININQVGLRKLGQLIGESHPQKIKHHLSQLVKKGFITSDNKQLSLTNENTNQKAKGTSNLFTLPIIGSANCGPATIYAHENIEGYIKISSKVVNKKSSNGLFVIKAVGDSMNKAESVKGGPIYNGDFVVIDSTDKQPQNGDYVLSIIEDTANIKRFYADQKQIALVSESTLPIQPIYIHKSDSANYLVGGKIIQIIHSPKIM
ncbi:MAG: S24 family peptidase [Candidatus Falkowbacteria bacterium]